MGNKPKVYIDGKEGTTGLQIYERLIDRRDIELLLISEEKRKDLWERKRMFDSSDVVFLCLPDDAAREIVELAEKPTLKVIDCSTAHRTAPGWDYGLPELGREQREKLRVSKRVSNPGCHATGFISIVYPLVKKGVVPRDCPLTCFSLTGYSGGGKKMIAEYEGPDKGQALYSPRIYGLDLNHKHLPEMQKVCSLKRPPVFCPIVDDYYKGMATTVSFHSDLLGGANAQMIHEVLSKHYQDERLVKVMPFGWKIPMLSANSMAGKDTLTLVVSGSGDQAIVTALFDNLGKGAAGAAVQNMNLMLGFDELTGLVTK